MEEKREEIYERIPWETLQNPRSDRQNLIIGLAVAVVAGALVYSFVANRSASSPAAVVAPTTVTAPLVASPPAPAASAPVAPPSSVPESIAEADLYAIAPTDLANAAVAHAEWFVFEYLTVDGSGESSILRQLLPEAIPLPVAPQGSLVFVEWVGALEVQEVQAAVFSVEVLARYMVAEDGQDYRRVEPEVVTVTVAITESGPQVSSAPSFQTLAITPAPASGLGDVPAHIADLVIGSHPDATIIGGVEGDGGAWEVVVVEPGPRGWLRPVSLVVQS